jgi:hypothetical protein
MRDRDPAADEASAMLGVPPAGDDRGSIVDHDRRQRVPASGLVGGWPAGWAGERVAWLVAGPVRVQPPTGSTQQPGQRLWPPVGLRPRSRPAPDDGANRGEPDRE